MLSVSLNNMNTLGAASPHWLHRKLPHKYTSYFLAETVGNVHLTLVFTFKNLPSIVSNFQTGIYVGDQWYRDEKLSGYSKK